MILVSDVDGALWVNRKVTDEHGAEAPAHCLLPTTMKNLCRRNPDPPPKPLSPHPPLVNGTGHSPSPGRPTPGVVKEDKSSGGSVDTTKTRSDPQRVRMCSGEGKGKQTNTLASCRTPPPP